ncbi:hypothetical protein ADK67_32910 [Saccharothrix sp. NRRL B-16348]|uniref:hypothetical protein n=1 Tax=Saccharothrix sp. NRRL B-16348 TaxID=1415542 RepID=UPI0006B060E3|nr:hypothetical protein [Saccharothrix sp. NRRL B-16348]KOX19731.1 hypothetical protein ADK67_32910 [Saccharothrix sp. NRRL B-16348]
MSTDEGTTARGELSAEQEEDLVEAMLRHQVGIDPHHVGTVLDVAAVGLVNSAWRNSPVEDWHAGDGPLSDGNMLRINSHTTHRVRDMIRRWRTDCGIDAHSRTTELDELDIAAVDWLVGRLCRWLIDPVRKLPTGVTLADLAGDDLDEFTDHVTATLGGVANLAEDHSTHYAFRRVAAHGGLACRHWWGTPTWPGLVDRFVNALDDPTDPHWGQDGQRYSRLPPRPRRIKDSAGLRRLRLRHPWKLDETSANYLVTAGIGYLRDPVPPLTTTPTTGEG